MEFILGGLTYSILLALFLKTCKLEMKTWKNFWALVIGLIIGSIIIMPFYLLIWIYF